MTPPSTMFAITGMSPISDGMVSSCSCVSTPSKKTTSAPASDVGAGALLRVLEARHRDRVRAGDDHEVGVATALDGGAQTAGVRLQAHEALVGVVAAAARHVLVLEVEAGGADVLHLVDQALHGEDRAVARLPVAQHRHPGCPHGAAHLGDRLGQRAGAEVRHARKGRGRQAAGEVDRREAGARHELRGQAVVGAGEHRHALGLDHRPKLPGIAICHWGSLLEPVRRQGWRAPRWCSSRRRSCCSAARSSQRAAARCGPRRRPR